MRMPYTVNGNERNYIYVRTIIKDIAGKEKLDSLLAKLDEDKSIHLFGIVHIQKTT